MIAFTKPTHAVAPRRARCRPAALLLEVVVALTVMVFALGMLGSQLIAGLRMTTESDGQTRAAQLADRIIALLELDMNVAERFFAEASAEGDFGEMLPGYFWHAYTDETREFEGLGLELVTVDILYQPNSELQEDRETAQVVYSVHYLKADPARIDLQQDFGVSPEQLAQFEQLAPVAGLDIGSLDPQQLVALEPEMLMQLLPQLLPLLQGQMMNGGQNAGGPIDPAMLQQLLTQFAAGGQLPAGMPGGAGGPQGMGGQGDMGGQPGQLPGGLQLPPGVNLDDLPPGVEVPPEVREALNQGGGQQGGGRQGGGRGGRTGNNQGQRGGRGGRGG